MPLGVVCAQVTHAAGESFYWLAYDYFNRTLEDTPFTVDGTVAVVLGVRDEKHLKYYARRLAKAGIDYIPVNENAGFAAGQMTAIGVIPTEDREKVYKILKKLNPISELSV